MQNLNIQSLLDSLWTFGALMSLGESGALDLLEKGASLETLLNQTKIPKEILTAILNLLIKAGFLTCSENLFKTTGDLAKKIAQNSSVHLINTMRSQAGQVREFIHASSLHQLKAGWFHTDPQILQAQGIFSEIVVTDFMPLFSDVDALLQKPGARFLDVGAGVGRIALKACDTYPHLSAVALEPADAPFTLARKNIETSSCGHRVELRKIGVESMRDTEAFDVIWIAQGFINEAHLIPGLQQLKKVLKPNGILITLEFYEKPQADKSLEFYTMDLMSALYDSVRTPTEVMQLLKNNGFTHIEAKPYQEYVSVIIARNNTMENLCLQEKMGAN